MAHRNLFLNDVGCGKGASTVLMAQSFPKSKFFGFDYHDKSIEAARGTANREGLADRVTFEIANAKAASARITTWSLFLTACTTWAIPRVSPHMSKRCWPRMGHG